MTLDSSLSYLLLIGDMTSPNRTFDLLTTETSSPATDGYQTGIGGISSGGVPASFAYSLSGIAVTPEPSSYAFGLIAFGALAFEVRRRRASV